MGYMGLDYIGESDNAAGLAFDADIGLAKILEKGLKEKGNNYNTCGVVNVALYFEERIKDCGTSLELTKVLNKCIKQLQLLIEKSKVIDFGSKENKKYHLTAYKRMLRNLLKISTACYV